MNNKAVEQDRIPQEPPPGSQVSDEAQGVMQDIRELLESGYWDKELFIYHFSEGKGGFETALHKITSRFMHAGVATDANRRREAYERICDGIQFSVPQLDVSDPYEWGRDRGHHTVNFPLGVNEHGVFPYPLNNPTPVSVLKVGKESLQDEWVRLVIRGADIANTYKEKSPRVRVSVFAPYKKRVAWAKEFAGLKTFGDPLFDDVAETFMHWRNEAQSLGHLLAPIEDSYHHIVVIDNMEHLFTEAGANNWKVDRLMKALIVQQNPNVHIIATVGHDAFFAKQQPFTWGFFGAKTLCGNQLPHTLRSGDGQINLWVPRV